MNPKSLKNKISRIPVLWKSGIVILMSGVLIGGFVFAQIPYQEGKVYVCPLATKIEEINPKCQCRIDLVLGETITSTCPIDGKNYEMTLTITEHKGKEYYAILGFENGGAGVNFEPQAKISAPFEGYLDKEILFDGSQSQDPNQDPLDFFWDFGDGNSAQGEKVSHLYKSPGEYLITLTVSDGMFSAIATTSLKILPFSKRSSKTLGYFEKKESIEKEIERSENFQRKEKEIEKIEKASTEKVSKEPKSPEKMTKILHPEKIPQNILEKETPERESISPKEKENFKTPKKSQSFFNFLLANLKSTITNFKLLLFSLFSIFIFAFIFFKAIQFIKKR